MARGVLHVQVHLDARRFGAGDVDFYREEGNHPTSVIDPDETGEAPAMAVS